MKNKNLNIFILLSLILIIILLISPAGIELLSARPGGGQSFSGGGGGSSGGGDGIGYLIYFILSVLPPQISIPLVIVIIVVRIYLQRRNKSESKTVSSSPGINARVNRNSDIETDIAVLKQIDPNFSKVLFLDFVSSVYMKYYSLFGKSEFKNLSPYFDSAEIASSRNLRNQQNVNEIVIGNMRISEINNLQTVTGISVDIEANYTLEQHGKKTRYSVVERWYFNKNSGVLSQEPDKMRKLVCPNCAAPANFNDQADCESCGTTILNGTMQWYVKKHKVLSQEVFKTKGLVHYEQERGTGLQTIYQTGFNTISADFANRHNIDWNTWRVSFSNELVSIYFNKIYEAWSENNLNSVRNLITDRLHESFLFWIGAYKKVGITNKSEDIKISNIQFVKIDTDKFYESVTVRIYASSLDYVVDKQGKVKGGSNKRHRSFSEYWTFIRRNGVEKDAYDFSTCPNCGAPADKMGQAGVCEYCGTKISTGDFSWVLAIISQDEVYTG